MVAAAWPGVRAAWPRRIAVPSSAACDAPGTVHDWHLLDNGPELEARGITPAGTLLCVHGNPTWSYLWRSVLEAATEADQPWRVIAVDQLDMGFSARTGTFRRLADRITDLTDLTNALGLTEPVVTLGHDWGGIISLGWAVAHPELLAGVVLANTAVHPSGFSLPPALRLALHPAVHRWGTRGTPAFLKVTHALAHPALAREVRDAFMAPYTTAARRTGVANFVADIPATTEHPSRGTLEHVSTAIRALQVPALLLWGPRDPVFSDRYLEDLAGRLPHADVHRFEGAGHLLPEDRDIATPLLQWLGQNLPSTRGGATGTTAGTPVGAGPRLEWTPPHDGARAYRPMLAELDARRGDASPAVVDMARTGAASARIPDAKAGSDALAPRVPVPAAAVASTLSWTELADRVDALARGLASIGVKAGDRVNLLVPPGSELTSLIYACLRLGAVIVVADAGLGTKGLGRAIKGARPAFLIGIDRALAGARLFGWPGTRIAAGDVPVARRRLLGVAHTVPDLLHVGRQRGPAPFPAAEPDADAAVLFTSGSTGPAKGVVYTHRQLAAMRDTLQQTYGLKSGDALVAGFAPFALLGPALGAVSVTPDMDVTSPRTLTAAALADAAAAIDATVVFASPAALVNVHATSADLNAAHRAALAKVSLLLSAGAPMGEAMLARIAELVPHAAIHTPYGMTEALPVTDISLEGIRAAGAGNGVCVGTPVAGAHVAIAPLGADGALAGALTTGPGLLGEIVVSAPHVKDRYDRLWITEQASAADPGWHHTGDVGHLDDAGRLWVEGRLGHILTSADGVRTPVAAELAAEQVPGAGRAAVVGVGPTGTQVPVAVIETIPPARRPGLAGPELTGSVRHAITAATGMAVAAVLVVPELPTDIRHNSKVDRSRLARWASTALAGGRIRKP